MEIKAILNKPYTEANRLNFIVENNHSLGYTILENESGLQAFGYTEEDLLAQQREQTAMLSLTAADVERAVYKAKGIDFEDILNLVKDDSNIDVKALKIELKANNFYRGNEYVNIIGEILGYSSDDLDYLFKNKELPNLEQEVNDVGMVL